MKDYFRSLFDYHVRANELFLDVLYSENKPIDEYAFKMFRHSIMAHHVWNHRMLDLAYDHEFWEPLSKIQLEQLMIQNKEETAQILNQFDLQDELDYKNQLGESFSSKIIDILSHISHHYAYHRGQIARSLRECGIEPPKTDLIIFRRT
ncbi:MAG: hypothetical protein IPG95_02895 [Saprospiraceae bacterium]|nr:hypothetical protein [Saprospiraceae bacterium]